MTSPSTVRSAAITLLATLTITTSAAAQTGAGIKGGLMASKFSTTPDISEVLGNLNDLTGGVFVVATPDTPVTAQFRLPGQAPRVLGPGGISGSDAHAPEADSASTRMT